MGPTGYQWGMELLGSTIPKLMNPWGTSNFNEVQEWGTALSAVACNSVFLFLIIVMHLDLDLLC
jgi:hypothetical protein